MRIAFYAPLKPPDHPVPSGDRRMARLLMAALSAAGHTPALAARFKSRDGRGDPARQARLRALGVRLADRYLRRIATHPSERPSLWLTYHLYYKAPDWIGPRVAAALGIPYVVAEASLAEKRRGGPWDLGHQATRDALAQADRVIGLNTADREGVLDAIASPDRWVPLKPFLDPAAFETAAGAREASRAELVERWRLDPSLPWLVAVAMMRPDVKRDSYQLLGAALARVRDRPFQLLIAGDGLARTEVVAALKPLGKRVRFLGALAEDAVPPVLAASDLFVWPAIGEAYGLAILEAQATGLPVVVGDSGGVGDIVSHGTTGLVTPVGDAGAIARAVASLIDDPEARAQMGVAARRKVSAEHGLAGAARQLDAVLRALVPTTPA
jgi:glycosyltransferase involved in cell wall biosynthesis